MHNHHCSPVRSLGTTEEFGMDSQMKASPSHTNHSNDWKFPSESDSLRWLGRLPGEEIRSYRRHLILLPFVTAAAMLSTRQSDPLDFGYP